MTDPQPDRVVERLRALDRVLATPPIDPRARERIREGLAREATTRPFATKLRWWPAFAFAYMSALAYVGALVTAVVTRAITG